MQSCLLCGMLLDHMERDQRRPELQNCHPARYTGEHCFHLEHIDICNFPGYQSVPYLVMHHQSTLVYGPVQPDLPLALHHVNHLCQEQSLSVHHETHWCDFPSYDPNHQSHRLYLAILNAEDELVVLMIQHYHWQLWEYGHKAMKHENLLYHYTSAHGCFFLYCIISLVTVVYLFTT